MCPLTLSGKQGTYENMMHNGKHKAKDVKKANKYFQLLGYSSGTSWEKNKGKRLE